MPMKKKSKFKLLIDFCLYFLLAGALLISVFVILIMTRTPYLDHVINTTPAKQNFIKAVAVEKDAVVDMHSTLAKLLMMEKKDLEYVIYEDDLDFDGTKELIAFTLRSLRSLR